MNSKCHGCLVTFDEDSPRSYEVTTPIQIDDSVRSASVISVLILRGIAWSVDSQGRGMLLALNVLLVARHRWWYSVGILIE